MATIQLDREILDVEEVIDGKDYDEVSRRMNRLRDRFGRRPEFRYLKTLFDVTFQMKPDFELLADTRSLVAEQPDFLEAVSLLSLLLDRTGDRERARVFAREAVQSRNRRARDRAAAVLGDALDADHGGLPDVDHEDQVDHVDRGPSTSRRRGGGTIVTDVPPPANAPALGRNLTERMRAVSGEWSDYVDDHSDDMDCDTTPFVDSVDRRTLGGGRGVVDMSQRQRRRRSGPSPWTHARTLMNVGPSRGRATAGPILPVRVLGGGGTRVSKQGEGWFGAT